MEKRKVVIEVLGGVADVTQCPDDVEVEIIDHDNEEPADHHPDCPAASIDDAECECSYGQDSLTTEEAAAINEQLAKGGAV